MKKISILLSISFLATSLLASSNSIEKDISTYLTHGRIKTEDIKIISTDKIGDLKDLHVAIGTIKNSRKPFLIIYNKDKIIVGNMIDRQNGKSIFRELLKKHNKEIKKAMTQDRKIQKANKIKNNKKLIKLINTKYKDLTIKIKGGNPNGKTIYLITDPNCPFCQEYERKELPKTIKKSKEIIVVPIYLNIRGHESSPLRSSWLIEAAHKNGFKDTLSLMHKASNPKDLTYKTVDKKFAQKTISKLKKLINSGLISGTPTVFDQNGNPMR